MATLWYCCGCNFGPFDADLYVSCINCGKHACDSCNRVKVTMSNYNTHNQALSPYPSVVAADTARTLSLETKTMAATGLGELHSIRSFRGPMPSVLASSFGGAVQYYSETYMYICCKCHDGPKVYNVQPQCVVCHHEACGECQQVK
ncbi:uncharacterized protein N7482_002534 [Penicillium canariense]|uniref:Uncharacterized protein n=1 Tax=Penicillium canariense TaxID=189055 RepID=A0A9W9LV80_9EURO|nr:uncharacterized protein N7482_002534 [Penicillium canariense]KAJ5176657.1 hypothetical protein N7482_002534 [Penicillium canariense]